MIYQLFVDSVCSSNEMSNLTCSLVTFLSSGLFQKGNQKLIKERLTLHVNATGLLSHRTGIYLAHVAAPIRLTQLLNSQSPRSHVFMNDTNTSIVSYDTFLQCKHCLITCT